MIWCCVHSKELDSWNSALWICKVFLMQHIPCYADVDVPVEVQWQRAADHRALVRQVCDFAGHCVAMVAVSMFSVISLNALLLTLKTFQVTLVPGGAGEPQDPWQLLHSRDDHHRVGSHVGPWTVLIFLELNWTFLSCYWWEDSCRLTFEKKCASCESTAFLISYAMGHPMIGVNSLNI